MKLASPSNCCGASGWNSSVYWISAAGQPSSCSHMCVCACSDLWGAYISLINHISRDLTNWSNVGICVLYMRLIYVKCAAKGTTHSDHHRYKRPPLWWVTNLSSGRSHHHLVRVLRAKWCKNHGWHFARAGALWDERVSSFFRKKTRSQKVMSTSGYRCFFAEVLEKPL